MSIDEMKTRLAELHGHLNTEREAIDQLEYLNIIRSCINTSLSDEYSTPYNLGSALTFFESLYEYYQIKALLLAYDHGKRGKEKESTKGNRQAD